MNRLNISFATFSAEYKLSSKRWDSAHKVVFGNGGGLGLKAKMWILWSVCGVVWAIVVSVLFILFRQS